MLLRDTYLPFGKGPFNLDAVGFNGGTIIGTTTDLHQLGQSMIDALATREEVTSGQWCVELTDASKLDMESVYADNELSIVFDNRFEWRLDWDCAYSLASDYTDTHLPEWEGGRKDKLSERWRDVKHANKRLRDENGLGVLLDRSAAAFVVCLEDFERKHWRHSEIGKVMDSDSYRFRRCESEIMGHLTSWTGNINAAWFEHFENQIRIWLIRKVLQHNTGRRCRALRLVAVPCFGAFGELDLSVLLLSWPDAL